MKRYILHNDGDIDYVTSPDDKSATCDNVTIYDVGEAVEIHIDGRDPIRMDFCTFTAMASIIFAWLPSTNIMSLQGIVICEEVQPIKGTVTYVTSTPSVEVS